MSKKDRQAGLLELRAPKKYAQSLCYFVLLWVTFCNLKSSMLSLNLTQYDLPFSLPPKKNIDNIELEAS